MAPEQPSLLLLQFSREPVPGQVKTRLLQRLSAQAACDLHCELTLFTLRRLLQFGHGDVELSVAGDPAAPFFRQCASLGEVSVSAQSDGDLGARMYHALSTGLRHYDNVLLVGSDCPGIDEAYLEQAVSALQRHDLVIGPATDGGYVLIGARRVSDVLFQQVDWGSGKVYAQTIARAERAGLSWQALPQRSDIDRPEDLALWQSIREGQASAAGGV